MTFEDLQKANEQINTTNIKGKEYAEVNQRIKAFRMCFPNGCIKTKMISNEGGVCVFKAEVYSEYRVDEMTPTCALAMKLLATGYAYENKDSSFINKTSYIENCETSATGRALGFAGFGIDTSIASAEEVQNAQLNQPLEKKYLDSLKKQCKKAGKKPAELEALKDCTDYDDMTFKQYKEAMKELGAE